MDFWRTLKVFEKRCRDREQYILESNNEYKEDFVEHS